MNWAESNERIHATSLPGSVAWVAERLGLVGMDGTVVRSDLATITVAQIAAIPFQGDADTRSFINDLVAVNGGKTSVGASFATVANPPNVAAAAVVSSELPSAPPTRRTLRTSRTIAKEERIARETELQRKAREWVMAHPGCTFEEVARGLQVDEPTATKIARPIDWLVLTQEELTSNGVHQESEIVAKSRVRATAALSAASLMVSPLSHQNYTKLIQDGRVQGPSVARIVQLFGSWKAACTAVGVESGDTLRQNYTRSWNREDLLVFVQEFLVNADYRGASHLFDKWRSDQMELSARKVPSLGTVRNVVGGTWHTIRTEALRGLRNTWN